MNINKDRLELMSRLWGNRKLKRVNEIIKSDYCGHLTVRELAVLALSDVVNFPQGIDTPICIGDFEGNFSTNIMSVSLGGTSLDKLVISVLWETLMDAWNNRESPTSYLLYDVGTIRSK